MKGLLAVPNFAQVRFGLYRGAQPTEPWQWEWLAGVLGSGGLVVNLRQEAHDQQDARFTHVRFSIADNEAPSREMALRWFDLLAQDRPTFFHCAHGRGRTSTFCVLARLAQGWSLDRAMREERERFGYTFPNVCQARFLREMADAMGAR